MKTKRKRHEAALKARGALEAIKGNKTVAEIASEYGIHPRQVADWKERLTDGVARVCDKDAAAGAEAGFARERTELQSKIGGTDHQGGFSDQTIQTTRPVSGRAGLVEKEHPCLRVRTQCSWLSVARSPLDYEVVGGRAEDLKIKRVMDEIHRRDPCMGSRQIAVILQRDHGLAANRKRVRRWRDALGLQTIFRGPKRSMAHRTHKKFPHLLRELVVTAPNQVWCSDITDVPMPHGHAFLCAAKDWKSRKAPGWAVRNTMDAARCLAALNMARQSGSVPDIFNPDQGRPFTSQEWVQMRESLGIEISMDGKGRWMDNGFLERLWSSVKHDGIYLREYATIAELENGLGRWFKNSNHWPPPRRARRHDARPGARAKNARIRSSRRATKCRRKSTAARPPSPRSGRAKYRGSQREPNHSCWTKTMNPSPFSHASLQ